MMNLSRKVQICLAVNSKPRMASLRDFGHGPWSHVGERSCTKVRGIHNTDKQQFIDKNKYFREAA